MRAKSLPALVQAFFTVALPERGLSPLTILAYRDAMKLLLGFIAQRCGRPVVRLDIEDVDALAVREFLAHLEKKRSNQVTTRNCRLAAIRSFFSFVAAEEPALAGQSRLVCLVPLKRAPVRAIPYLDQDEMRALMEAPALTSDAGRRDHALLLFLYNTGARVQELADVRAADLRLSSPRQVLLRGKGRKERICPLWRTTARALRELLERQEIAADSDQKVFLNVRGQPLTRFGVNCILKKHATVAARRRASLARKRVSPHVIRHTAAVHLLNSGVDINVIRSWLGHVDLRTTSVYAEIDLATKRKAIEACAARGARRARHRAARWEQDRDLLRWLEQL
jgi:site-specific recombinase XerD